jgi:hypothetical protein
MFAFDPTRKMLPPQMLFSITHMSRSRSCQRRQVRENRRRSAASKSRSPFGITHPGSRW